MTGWRRCPFSADRSYRVLETFDVPRDHFDAGEILVFKYDGHSIYDGATAYFFNDSAGGWRTFDVPDDVAEPEFARMVDKRFQALDPVSLS